MAANDNLTTALDGAVKTFEQIQAVFPDDLPALEFLSAAYVRQRRTEEAACLAALLKNAEAAESQAAAARNAFSEAQASECALAEELGSEETVKLLAAQTLFRENEAFSALLTMAREHTEDVEVAMAKLADKYAMPPVPLEGLEPDRRLMLKLGADLVLRRCVVPFTDFGGTVLAAFLSPNDAALRRRVEEKLNSKVVFFLAEPLGLEKLVMDAKGTFKENA